MTKFPHVAIINPYTGEIIWRKDGWTVAGKDELTAETFSEKVMNLPERPKYIKRSQRALSRTSSGVVSSSSNSTITSRGDTDGNGDNDDDDNKSWELVSLLESWERLSVGSTSVDEMLDNDGDGGDMEEGGDGTTTNGGESFAIIEENDVQDDSDRGDGDRDAVPSTIQFR